MSEASFRFALVCEGIQDVSIACDLVDRILQEKIDWWPEDPKYCDSLRKWSGFSSHLSYLKWSEVPKLALSQGIHVLGRYSGTGGHTPRQALLLLKKLSPLPDVVFLIRDTDEKGEEPLHKNERRLGLEAACQENWPFVLILGTPHPKRECWVLAGFEPQSEVEKAKVVELRRHLGFDPRTQAERLTVSQGQAKPGSKKDAKLVLAELTQENFYREELCWKQTELRLLRERGQKIGLVNYLEQIQNQVVPLFDKRK